MTSAVRASVYTLVAVSFALPLHAQGWIIPRPCGAIVRPMDERIPRPILDCRPNISRTRSDVRVELSDRVLQVRSRRAIHQSRRERRRSGLSVSASGQRGVSGLEALDQRRARRPAKR